MGNAASAMAARRAMSWQQLTALTRNIEARDCADIRANGPSSSRSTLRLFGQAESNVRLTLFRDKHSWCPYCQKVWLWLEEKNVPYKIEKVTMFCYGDKESWYTRKVPNGMLPAVELDGEIITESDEILVRLEQAFGPLHRSINHSSDGHCSGVGASGSAVRLALRMRRKGTSISLSKSCERWTARWVRLRDRLCSTSSRSLT